MPTESDVLADWLRSLLDERAGPARAVISSYRGITERQVDAGAGDRFREALLTVSDAEAKLRLVELHRGGHACRTEEILVEEVGVDATGGTDWTRRAVEWSTLPCLTLRLLASPFWGWRGWRSTWSL